MDSTTLPRDIRVERFVAKALRAAIPLASLGVLGFLILGSSRPGSSAIAVLVLFAFAFPLAAGAMFFWRSMGLSKIVLAVILVDMLTSLKLTLALTATTMVFIRGGSQALAYGALLLLLFMLSVGLRAHADSREERAESNSSKTLPAAGIEQKLGVEPASTSEVASETESLAVAVDSDSDLKARLKSALPLLKRNS